MELIQTSLISDANLMGYYRLNNGSLLIDSSSKGRNLTNVNSVGEGAGKFSGAADLGTNNTGKYLYVDNDMEIRGGAGSINCWIKTPTTTSANDHETWVSVGDAGTQTELMIWLGSTGAVAARLKNAVAYQSTSQATISANTWYMMTLTYDTTNLKFYLNGSLINSIAASGTGTSGASDKLTIGRRVDPSDLTYADGLVDDVAVFNRALTAAEITLLSSPAAGGFFPFFM